MFSDIVVLVLVAQSCLTLCDPMDCSTPGFPIHHQLPELTQTHVHQVSDAIQTSHPLLSPSSPAFNQPRQHIKKQRHYFANKHLSSQGYVFPVVMCGCESWTIKKAECQRIDAFELWCWRRLESPLDFKEIQPVHSKDQPWVFLGRNDAKAETPVLWPPHVKS